MQVNTGIAATKQNLIFIKNFSLPDGSLGGNVIIFEADMSSSVHNDNNTKDILIPGEGPTPGLDNTTKTAKAIYPINFKQPNKRIVLSLHYNESSSLFVNATKSISSKQKTLK